jgi:hypothetical protein
MTAEKRNQLSPTQRQVVIERKRFHIPSLCGPIHSLRRDAPLFEAPTVKFDMREAYETMLDLLT